MMMYKTFVRRRVHILSFVFLLALSLRALAADQYFNPLDVHCADPFILHQDKTYYLYGTYSDEGFVVWTSSDLVNWQQRGHAFRRTKQTWSRDQFWAPEVFAHKNRYYLHFTVLGGGKDLRRIVLTDADSPLGPFKEIKTPWFDPGQATIDSHVFRDTDGKLYLYSVDLNRPDRKCFEIHVRELDDQLNPQSHYSFCVTPSQPWEGLIVNEGPFVLKRGDRYILTYSANGYFDPNYSIGLATSKSPLGPWTKVPDPILRRTPEVSGPGHHCFVDSPDGSEWFIAYHTHQQLSRPSGARQLAIDRIQFLDQPPYIRVAGPTVTPQPMPSGSPPLVRGQDDEFSDANLDRRRWNVFGEVNDHWSIADGHLIIRTEDGDVYLDRSDLRNLFLEHPPPGDFTVMTRVAVHPEKDHEQAFLTLWQNHNRYVKLAVVESSGLKFEVAAEHEEQFDSELHAAPEAKEYWLRIGKHDGSCDLAVSTDGTKWEQLSSKNIELQNVRVGIGACSPGSGRAIPASFDFVRFTKSP